MTNDELDTYAHKAQIDGPCSIRAVRQALKDAGLILQKEIIIPDNWGMQAELALAIQLLKLSEKLPAGQYGGGDVGNPKT